MIALGFVIYSITGIGVLTSIRLQAIIILSYEGECDLHEESHVSHLIICLVCPAYLFSQGHEKTLRQAATWNKQWGFLKIAPRISSVPFHSGWEAEPCMSSITTYFLLLLSFHLHRVHIIPLIHRLVHTCASKSCASTSPLAPQVTSPLFN